VFSESARGSLIVGLGCGRGSYAGGAVGVLLQKEDGTRPTEAEVREAREKAEQWHRREWESAIPLNSRPGDVYCFELMLSVGEISEELLGDQRRRVLEQLRPDGSPEETLEKSRRSLEAVLSRCAAGEALRIWYSHNPEELCGMYWLMAQLRRLDHRGTVYLVKLPQWEYRGDGEIVSHTGWGEISPGRWGHYQSLQQEAKPPLFAMCAHKWALLRQENAPLRACLNGQLQSFPADIYDSFLLRELENQPEVFSEAMLIGNVLGKYQLCIGDAWVALRIETLIGEGKLEIWEAAPAGESVYRRKLKKVLDALG